MGCPEQAATILVLALRSVVAHVAASPSPSASTSGSTPRRSTRASGASRCVDHNGKLLYGRNERRLFTPASNTKLVVTAVALGAAAAGLHGAHQPLRGGTGRRGGAAGRPGAVRPGRSDLQPAMLRDRHAGRRRLRPRSVRPPPADGRHPQARGIRQVEGDLVGDGSYFEPASLHPGWELFDLNWWYAAPVSALAFNDNSLDFVWQPGLRSARPRSSAVARPGRRRLRESHRHGAGRRRDRHRRPLLPPSGNGPGVGRRDRRARSRRRAPSRSR